jgi:L-lactate dehydrogenase
VVSNPVDVLTLAALKLSGFPRERVIGSGTVLDSMRFRALIGRHCGVSPRNVHAYVVGEHGDTELPAWSGAHIAGVSIADYCTICGRCPGHQELGGIFAEVRNAAYEIIARKGYTNYAIATGMVALVRTILRDEKSILTVSTLLSGEYGVSDVCLSLPSVIGRGGAERVIGTGLSAGEAEAFRESARVVAEVARSC